MRWVPVSGGSVNYDVRLLIDAAGQHSQSVIGRDEIPSLMRDHQKFE